MPDQQTTGIYLKTFTTRLTVEMTLVVISVFFLFHVNLFSQPPSSSSNYTFRQLILDNNVQISRASNAIQDSLGYVWFGSRNGLIRYDGHSFKHYHKDNREDFIPVNDIKKIAFGNVQSEIFFQSGNSIYLLNTKNGNCTKLKIELSESIVPKNSFDALFLRKNTSFWVMLKFNWEGTIGRKLSLYKFDNLETFEQVTTFEHKFLSENNRQYYVNHSSTNGESIFINLNQTIAELDDEGKILNLISFPGGEPGGHFVDENATLWVTTLTNSDSRKENKVNFFPSQGIYFLEKGADDFEKFQVPDSTFLSYTPRIFVNKNKVITYGGLVASFDKKTFKGSLFGKEIKNIQNYMFNDILSITNIMQDNSGVYWLSGATMFLMEEEQRINHIAQGGSIICNGYKCPVRGITEDRAGNIYFSANGINRFDPKTNQIIPLDDLYDFKSQWDTWNMTVLGNELYTDNYKLNLNTGEQTFLLQNKKNLNRVNQNSHLIDKEGFIWYGMYSARLKIYDPSTGAVTPFSNIHDSLKDENCFISMMFSALEGNQVWVVTNDHGIFLVDRIDGIIKHYFFDFNNQNSLLSSSTYSAAEDGRGNLWIGSSMGLSKVNLKSDHFLHFRIKDGLPGSQVNSMICVKDGIWLGTNNGISYFNFSDESFANFGEKEGIVNKKFNGISAFQSKDGKMYFGGLNGIDAFYPDDLLNPKISHNIPFQILELNQFDGNENITNGQNLLDLTTIRLKPNNQYFDLTYRLADYREQANTLYQYKLEGYDQNWSNVSYSNDLRYENTPPGNYTLRVKGTISPTIWNDKELNIQIIKEQFWYKKTWAIILFIALGVLLTYQLYKNQLNRKLEKAEATRIFELDELKTKLYTNITHEFRTPLTVIQGMAETMTGDQEAKTLIKRNSKNLLHLVTQLLDMSKLESGKMALNLIHGNIVSFIAYLTSSFESLAASKQISLTFDSNMHEVMMDYDPDKVQHVMANLISNAVKFTQENGKISVFVSTSPSLLNSSLNPLLKIVVADNGLGIKPEHVPHIFNRFYQVDESNTRKAEGTGIGLALTKELAEVMGGSISAKSEFAQGTEFSVLLPILASGEVPFDPYTFKATPDPLVESALALSHSSDHFINQLELNAASKTAPLLLLIEDNLDVTKYIKTCLVESYQVHVAHDGEEGINKALELIPDLIICDVMMPKKDGFEVTAFLKSNEHTSHIPIVLLTAKADLDSKITGLSRGADAYLTKPFHKEELLIRLQKLFELRKVLQSRYSAMSIPAPTENIALQIEDAFLTKIREAVETHLADATFNVDELCKEIGMSQSQLYRKIKALTNKSTASYIRSIRLHSGKILLETTDLTVSEVAYDVGFTDPSYFSKTFSSEFGFSPSERVKKGSSTNLMG